MTVFTVTSNADSGPGTLRNIIGSTVNGDVILFNPSVTLITLASEIFINKAITISGNGIANTVISGNNITRIFNISSITTDSLIIVNLSLVDGDFIGVNGGGAASIINSNVNLNNVVFNSNRFVPSTTSVTSRGGGALYIQTSTVNFSNCVFTDNLASVPFQNSQSFGGAIYQIQSTTNINNCTFTENQNFLGGGAIYYENNPSVSPSTIRDSTFNGNRAIDGSAFYIDSTYLSMINSTVTANSNIQSGGCTIRISNNSSVTYINNTISRNITQSSNVILILSSSLLQIANNIISINNNNVNIDINNTSGSVSDFGSNMFSSVSTIIGFSPHPTDIYGNPQLDTLGNYGGPTQTLPPLTTSPVIDAGNVGVADFVALTTDQRGLPRFCGTGDNRTIDIGSVQIGSCNICYIGSTRILTKNITTGIIQHVPAENVYSGIHEVFDTINQCWTPVKANILTDPETEFFVILKNTFGENQPMNDLYLTGGHPIIINGVEIEAQKIPQAVKVKIPKTQIYSIATQDRIAISIEGLNVLTWNYDEWISTTRKNVIKWRDNKIPKA